MRTILKNAAICDNHVCQMHYCYLSASVDLVFQSSFTLQLIILINGLALILITELLFHKTTTI